MNNKYISWRRVSTFKQNRSGLGLEAQKEIINYFVERDGGTLIADYSECYTGKELSGCVELRKAMAHAKKEGAILVIAKSDRFRNCQEALGILTEMGEGNLEFCDLPHSDRFTLTLFWALAEREALITSIRTKQALAVKKAQGCRLGAASDKYKETYNNKTKETKDEEQMKRGVTKNRRYLESRDTQTMFRVLKRVFPDVTQGEPQMWDWSRISTANGAKDIIYSFMKEYKDYDDTHATFHSWDFDDVSAKPRHMQQKLASYIRTIKDSVLLSVRNNYN